MTECPIEEVGVFLPFKESFVGAVLFQAVEVFEEEEPGGLLGVVEFCGAAGFLVEDVVYVFEGLPNIGGEYLVYPLQTMGDGRGLGRVAAPGQSDRGVLRGPGGPPHLTPTYIVLKH